MALILENINIVKRNSQQYLCKHLNFSIENGKILTLMGASGCGKSTLLSAIAGHLNPDFEFSGKILLNQINLTLLAPHQRKIGLLFQNDLLFPHLNIWENLAFALSSSLPPKTRYQQAKQVLTRLKLQHIAEHRPYQISGGQRARISLMRTLLAQPKAVLLDEPFSKLDKALRNDFRQFVFEQIQQLNIPAVIVTHDQDDVPINGEILSPWG